MLQIRVRKRAPVGNLEKICGRAPFRNADGLLLERRLAGNGFDRFERFAKASPAAIPITTEAPPRFTRNLPILEDLAVRPTISLAQRFDP